MELYAAIDLHSNNSVLVVTDAEDHVVFSKRLGNDLRRVRERCRPPAGAARSTRGAGAG